MIRLRLCHGNRRLREDNYLGSFVPPGNVIKSGNQFFETRSNEGIYAREISDARASPICSQPVRRRLNERLTTATLRHPRSARSPLERLLITRHRVFVFTSTLTAFLTVFSLTRAPRRDSLKPGRASIDLGDDTLHDPHILLLPLRLYPPMAFQRRLLTFFIVHSCHYLSAVSRPKHETVYETVLFVELESRDTFLRD